MAAMRVVFRHGWMQKHPTPTRSGGDFHWHPAGVPAAIRGTLTELISRARGQAASLWVMDASYAAWARVFSAVSPSDQRRYTGLVVTVAEAQGSAGWFGRALPEILARMPLPPAGPFSGGDTTRTVGIEATPGATAPLAVDPQSLIRLFDDCDRDLAAAVYLGGQVFSRDPLAERLPALVGRLLTWLPPGERARPRAGVITGSRAGLETRSHAAAVENLLHYLAAAWFCPEPIRRRRPGFAVDAWQLVFDLARAGSCALPEVFAELTRVAAAWDTADNLRAHLVESGTLQAGELAEADRRAPRPLCAAVADAGWLWNRLLHYWGRGFVPANVLPRLAGLLARRVAVDHLFHLDAPEQIFLPRRYVRRLRYEALLPRDRVTAMTREVARHVPSLFASEVQLV